MSVIQVNLLSVSVKSKGSHSCTSSAAPPTLQSLRADAKASSSMSAPCAVLMINTPVYTPTGIHTLCTQPYMYTMCTKTHTLTYWVHNHCLHTHTYTKSVPNHIDAHCAHFYGKQLPRVLWDKIDDIRHKTNGAAELVHSSSGIAISMNSQRTAQVISSGSYQPIHTSKLWTFGLLLITYGRVLTVINWFTSYSSGRVHSVHHNRQFSEKSTMRFCVPQESVLGPLVFLLYTADRTLWTVAISLCWWHTDVHLLLPGQHTSTADTTLPCIFNIKVWISSNCLKLNPTTKQFFWCTTQWRLHLINKSLFVIGNATIQQVTSVWNLGILTDHDLLLQLHLARLTCFRVLRQARAIKPRHSYRSWSIVTTAPCQADMFQSATTSTSYHTFTDDGHFENAS